MLRRKLQDEDVNKHLTQSQVDLLKRADQNEDQLLDYEEFKKLVSVMIC